MSKTQQQSPDKAPAHPTQDLKPLVEPDKHGGPMRMARAIDMAAPAQVAAPERARSMITLQRSVGNMRVGTILRAADPHAQEPASELGEQHRDGLSINSLRMGEAGHIQRQAAAKAQSRQRADITAPLDEIPEQIEQSPQGGVVAEIAGVQVTILADTQRELGDEGRTETTFDLRAHYPGARTLDGKVVAIDQTPRPTMTLLTTYAVGEKAGDRSAYGRGTTPKDQEAGRTSLGFHEGRHALDLLQYLRAHRLPQFGGRVGMSVAKYQQAQAQYRKAIKEYKKAMKQDTLTQTDCVGTPSKDCPKNSRQEVPSK
jgi:hypothetical protein